MYEKRSARAFEMRYSSIRNKLRTIKLVHV